MLDQSVVTRPWTTTMDRAGKRRDGDWAMFVAGGRGVGQWRLLSPESAGVHLRVTKPWRVIPDATSTVIVQRVFRDNTIRRNGSSRSSVAGRGGNAFQGSTSFWLIGHGGERSRPRKARRPFFFVLSPFPRPSGYSDAPNIAIPLNCTAV
jgi:hypothetical protein